MSTEKKKQKPSASYTLKQMKELSKKLQELKLLDENEVMILDELRQKAIKKFYEL